MKSAGALRIFGTILVCTQFATAQEERTIPLSKLTENEFSVRWDAWVGNKVNEEAAKVAVLSPIRRIEIRKLASGGAEFDLVFDLKSGADQEQAARLLNERVWQFINQKLLESSEVAKIKRETDVRVSVKLAGSPGDNVLPRRPKSVTSQTDLFTPPPGLTMPFDQLVGCLGWRPSHCVPLTANSSYEIAKACYRAGLYRDAAVFAADAASKDGQAAAYFIKGVSELAIGSCNEATRTASDMNAANAAGKSTGLAIIMESFGGPLNVRFRDIARAIDH